MTNREIISNQLRHIETPFVPYTFACEDDVGKRLDAYYGMPDWRKRLRNFMTNVWCLNTELRVPVEGTGYVRDLYGSLWDMNLRPWHLVKPALEEPSFDGYEFPKAEVFFNPEGKEKARLRCLADTENFRMGFVSWGLFETSWTLRGFENALMDIAAEPDFFQEMIDRLTENFLQYVDYVCELPVDAIFFGDDWGDQQGVIVGADRWRKFFKPAWAKIYERVHASGKFIISHSCGSVVDIIPDLIEIGLDCLESCQPEARGMNPYELKKRFGDKIAFWGCLGSQSILPFGTPEAIRTEVTRLRSEMARGGGFILAPAKPLQPETPTANAVALVEALACSG